MNEEKNTNQIIEKDEKAHPRYNLEKIHKIGMAALLLLTVWNATDYAIKDIQDRKHPIIIGTEKFTFHENDNLYNDAVAVSKEIAKENGADINKIISPWANYTNVEPGDEFSVKLIELRNGGYKTLVEPAGYFKAEDFK